MIDPISGEPGPQDFREAAERSQAAGIADESASYVNAAPPVDEQASGNVAGGNVAGGDVQVPEAMTAEVDEGADTEADTEGADTEPADMTPDASDSIEPFHIPGSAEDIEVAGETGPGPSGCGYREPPAQRRAAECLGSGILGVVGARGCDFAGRVLGWWLAQDEQRFDLLRLGQPGVPRRATQMI